MVAVSTDPVIPVITPPPGLPLARFLHLWSNQPHARGYSSEFRQVSLLMRPIRASVRLGALSHNLSVVRARAPRSKVWAVVKANAYGHGLDRLMPALGSADGLAMLEVDAALNLKNNGERRPIMLLEGFFSTEELRDVASSGLIPVVHSLEQVAMLEGTHVTRPVDIYLKLNSGMNRLGFAPDVARSTLARLRATGKIGSVTAMTHFADADGNRGVAEQMVRTRAILAGLGESAPVSCSFANSAAILGFPDTHADWVRPGIMLYGCSPFGEADGANAGYFGLQPVMTLQSRIIAVQSLVAGDRVGYGGIFTAPSSMRAGMRMAIRDTHREGWIAGHRFWSMGIAAEQSAGFRWTCYSLIFPIWRRLVLAAVSRFGGTACPRMKWPRLQGP